MYRGTPYLNRQIKRREQQRSMEYHISNLTHIRPRTGTIQYPNQIHINNRKGQMQKQARFTQIQRQNRILLEKISSIMGKQSRKGSSQQKMNRSLNSELRKRQLQNIEVENAKLLKRLQQRKPNYQTQKFKESWKKQKYVIKNMSNYPFIINDRKRKRSSVSQIGGKQHNPNTIQLCRMRIIDGVSFLITIRLNQQRMQIIGDTKDKREIKVIQIDRDEAIQFIQQQCQGKIEKIFDCLRYDKSDQVLYLVANEVEIQDVKNQATMRMKKNSKRDENPEFDFSEDIPIRVNNQQENKLWVEVDPKKTQMKQKVEEKKRENTVKKSEQSMNYEQSGQKIAQKSEEWRKKQIKIQEVSQNSKKVESSVNTYEKIKKRSQQSQKHLSEKPKLEQKIESNQIDSSINKQSQKMNNEYKQDSAIEQPGQSSEKYEENQAKVEKSKQIGQSDKQVNSEQVHDNKEVDDQYQIDQQQLLDQQKEEGKQDQEKGQQGQQEYEEQFAEDQLGQNDEAKKEEEIEEEGAK